MAHARSKKILLVPLDWGLGHTTRCIPIIKQLIALGCEVQLGGTDITNALLKKEFPDLVYHSYPSYAVSYPEKASDFLKHIIKQMPSVALAVSKERKLTQALVDTHKFDIIISDNRFGVQDKRCKSIFITHQLNVLLPQSKLLAWLTNWKNHGYINRFDKVLVPDNMDSLLSGVLTNTNGIKIPIEYLNNLSRWNYEKQVITKEESVLAILSGPEPQRTLLEKMLIEQSANLDIELTIVRAKPNEKKVPKNKEITFYNHLDAASLQKRVQESEVVISRAGYSTIMDLVAVQKNAILIPTPGQTEQEYLAEYLENQKLFHFYNQENFDLKEAMAKFKLETWSTFPVFENRLKEILENVIR